MLLKTKGTPEKKVRVRPLKKMGTVVVHKRLPRKSNSRPLNQDLPFSYGKTKLSLLVRDPEWGYAYWDFSAETWFWLEGLYRRDPGCSAKLRIHNLDENSHYDIDVHLDAKNWYIQFGMPNVAFEVELGLIDSKGKFYSIARSNRVRTPRNRPSDKIDPAWNPADVGWDDIYRLSGGELIGRSSGDMFSPVKKRA